MDSPLALLVLGRVFVSLVDMKACVDFKERSSLRLCGVKVIPGYKWNFKGKGIPLDAHTVADCCAAATKLKLVFWQFHEGNKSCETGMGLDPTTPNGEDPDGIMAYSTSILPKPCNCSRVHTTVRLCALLPLLLLFRLSRRWRYPVVEQLLLLGPRSCC